MSKRFKVTTKSLMRLLGRGQAICKDCLDTWEKQ
jgi:hypothetical protein